MAMSAPAAVPQASPTAATSRARCAGRTWPATTSRSRPGPMPLDQCSVLVQSPLTRWLSALYPGVRGRDQEEGRGSMGYGLRELAIPDAVQSGGIRIDGVAGKLAELFGLLDEFTLMFEVVEPKRSS